MVRLLAALALLACLVGLAIDPPKSRVSEPSKLEKTCFFRGAWMPCFIKDEALQSEFNV